MARGPWNGWGKRRNHNSEIDPPSDDISIHRKSFYERCGFKENAFSHVHPPYHKGNTGHELVIMSSPAPCLQKVMSRFIPI